MLAKKDNDEIENNIIKTIAIKAKLNFKKVQ